MKNLLLAAAIAASTASPSVMAAIYSSASLSNINIALIDLDLTDNIQSKISFFPPVVDNSTFGVYSNSYAYGILNNYVNFTEGYVKLSILNNTVSGSVSNGSSVVNSAITLNELYATNLQTSGTLDDVSIFTYFFSESKNRQLFTLSANTRLQITADSNLYLEATDNYIGSSQTSIKAELSNSNYYDPIITASDSAYLNSDINQPINQMKALSIFIDNLTSLDVNGVLVNSAYNSGRNGEFSDTNLSSVPVPAALPLMASALGLFGLGAKRRKTAKS